MHLQTKLMQIIVILSLLACGGLLEQATPSPTESESTPVEETVADMPKKAVSKQWASTAESSSDYAPEQNAENATGEPNMPAYCFDGPGSWTSAVYEGQEWLAVYYNDPVHAEQVNIIESYGPSQVSLVELIDTDGKFHVVHEETPQLLEVDCPYTLTVNIPTTDYLVNGVRITIDHVEPTWTAIDAVQLVGHP